MTRVPVPVVVFDLDGTITKTESIWSHLHDRFGTWDLGRKFADLYWSGKITYSEWAKHDASCWRGIPASELDRIAKQIEYHSGARETFHELKARSKSIGIVSAGLSFLADKVKGDLGADWAVANELEIVDEHISGQVRVRVEVSNKGRIAEETVESLGFEPEQIASVGDNVYDFASRARLKIAFNPRSPEAERASHVVIRSGDLRDILNYVE